MRIPYYVSFNVEYEDGSTSQVTVEKDPGHHGSSTGTMMKAIVAAETRGRRVKTVTGHFGPIPRSEITRYSPS